MGILAMIERQGPSLGQVSDFDLRMIRVFKAVVECGGFTAAEDMLGISRSAISLHMNDLEKRLGLLLCQRGRGGFSLTEEGRQVYEAGLTMLASLETFRTEVNGLHDSLRGELNIGISDNLVSLPRESITHSLADLKARGPNVRINLSMEVSDSVVRGVSDGRFHVGVVPDVNLLKSLASEELYDERSLLYSADTHPLYAMQDSSITKESLAEYDAVIPCYIGYLPDHLAAPWVAAGRLRAICPERFKFLTPLVTITRYDRRPHRVLETFLALLATRLPLRN